MIRYRPSCIPCSRPNRWGFARGLPAGSLHQGTQLYHEFTHQGVAADMSQDRYMWPVDLLGAPVLDWADGDGQTPHVGPALETVAGVPVAGFETPWRCCNATPLTCTYFPTNSHYRTATATNPTVNQDMVILAVFRHSHAGGGAVVATRTGGAGYQLYATAPNIVFRSDDGVGNVVSAGAVAAVDAWQVVGVTYDDDGDQYLYQNGILIDNDPVGALGALTGNGMGINGRTDGSQDLRADIARVMVWYGAGLAEIATGPWHLALSDAVLGTLASQGVAGAFVRATGASWQDSAGIWHLAGANLQRAGDEDGFVMSPLVVNEAYANHNPQAGDAALALTCTGGLVPTEVDDSVALTAAGAREFGPNVFQAANATGNPQYIRMSAQTGDVNPRSLQCLIRRTAGAGAVNLGLYNEVGGAFVAGAAIHDGYDARTLVHGQVPAAATCTMCIEIADGTTIRWAAHQMEELPRATTPVPNAATAATATRNADQFTTSDTPPDEGGGLSMRVTPLGWSGAETAGASLLWTVWGASATLLVTAAGVWELQLDGTNTITTTAAPADGVEQFIRFFWTPSGGIVLRIDDEVWTAPYDGTIRWAGAWQLLAQQAEFQIRDFTTYRNGSG